MLQRDGLFLNRAQFSIRAANLQARKRSLVPRKFWIDNWMERKWK